MSKFNATSQHADSPGVNFMPPAVFFICLAGGYLTELWLHWPVQLLPHPIGHYTGLTIALIGLLFGLLGNVKFRSLGVNVKPNLPASQLVTKGIYRFSRNPMYVGFILALFGIGIAKGSIPMVLSAVPMFLYLNWYVIRREEKYLARVFGEEYEAYRRRVRRWL